jgi:hypothetical protein
MFVGVGRTLSSAAGSIMEQSPESRHRVCDMGVGNQSGPLLEDAQLGFQTHLCFIPAAATLVEIDVSADHGEPSIVVGRDRAGTTIDVLSSALATARSGWNRLLGCRRHHWD